MHQKIERLIKEGIQNLDEGFCLVDKDLNLSFWNKWLEDKTGISPGTVLGTPFIDLVRPGAKEYVTKRLQNAFRFGQKDHLSQSFNKYLIKIKTSKSKSFSVMQQKVFITPLLVEGKIDALAIVIQDVTIETERIQQLNINRKDLEKIIDERTKHLKTIMQSLELKVEERTEDLKKAKEVAEHASQAKSNFLTMMSHELRTPMNGVLGMAHLLKESTLDEDQQKYCDTILTSGNMLTQLLSDILDLSKAEAKMQKTDIKAFSFEELMVSSVDLFDGSAKSKGLDLSWTLDPKIEKTLLGDMTLLKRIISNLVGNAVKFTHDGKITITVQLIEDTLESQKTLFQITDTGIGVSKEQQKEIFEPFIQADSGSTRKYEGTGLGLAIVYELVVLLGGTIDISSEEGKGSCFTFTLTFEKPSTVAD
ncbi:MAG: ATP-binding protein [SAR324 cluster bacterium]|nr:ATP-binding protein [SAR324 cluster bacterium]